MFTHDYVLKDHGGTRGTVPVTLAHAMCYVDLRNAVGPNGQGTQSRLHEKLHLACCNWKRAICYEYNTQHT
jgi:hypothetical protein